MVGILYFGTQAPDVDVHGAGAAQVIVAPDLVEQGFAGIDAAGVGGQQGEQLELLVGEGNAPAGHIDFVAAGVNGELAHADDLVRIASVAAEDDLLDAGQQFGGVGRGGDKVVGLERRVILAQGGPVDEQQRGQLLPVDLFNYGLGADAYGRQVQRHHVRAGGVGGFLQVGEVAGGAAEEAGGLDPLRQRGHPRAGAGQ